MAFRFAMFFVFGTNKPKLIPVFLAAFLIAILSTMGLSEEVEAEYREVYECYSKDKQGNDKGTKKMLSLFCTVVPVSPRITDSQ